MDVPYSIYERLLIMWEEVEYASLVGYPEALETAQRHADTTLERSLLVGETKNTVLMRMVRSDLLPFPPLCPAYSVRLLIFPRPRFKYFVSK